MPVEIFWHSHLFLKGLKVLLVHRAVAGPASPVRAEVALETVIIMFPELFQIPLPCHGDLVQDKIRYRDRPDFRTPKILLKNPHEPLRFFKGTSY